MIIHVNLPCRAQGQVQGPAHGLAHGPAQSPAQGSAQGVAQGLARAWLMAWPRARPRACPMGPMGPWAQDTGRIFQNEIMIKLHPNTSKFDSKCK